MKFFVKGDNGVFLKCETLNIKDGDTIRVSISDKWDFDESAEVFNELCKAFPKNKVIGCLEGMTLVKENEY